MECDKNTQMNDMSQHSVQCRVSKHGQQEWREFRQHRAEDSAGFIMCYSLSNGELVLTASTMEGRDKFFEASKQWAGKDVQKRGWLAKASIR